MPGHVRVAPILRQDVDAVATFLSAHLNANLAPDAWARAMVPPWPTTIDNHGFLVRDRERVVGVQLAFYATRDLDGQERQTCNLGAWCVLPDYRLQGLRLVRAVLAQPGLEFTDLSPSGNVVAINERLGFAHLDTAASLSANVPLPRFGSRDVVTSDVDAIERVLDGAQLQILRDHRSSAAAVHTLIRHGFRQCYVIWRRDRRKNLPLFASLLHVEDAEVFSRSRRAFGSHLALRHRVPFLIAELRLSGSAPRASVRLENNRHKMYRSESLAPPQIDYLYSELTELAW